VSVHQVGFNFNLHKMHGEYNIKYTLVIRATPLSTTALEAVLTEYAEFQKTSLIILNYSLDF
jgi:hypothetical protein